MAESTSYNLLKNSSYSFLGYSLPIVFSIFITPIIVKKLGVTDYGIYILVITINGFLGLVDLGIGLALIKFASEYRARGEIERPKKLIGSANLLFLFFGLLGFITYFVIGKFFLGVFNIPPEQQAHILPVFLLAGVIFLFGSLAIVPASLLKAWQRYDLTVKVALVFLTVFNAAFLIAVLFGFKLKAVYAANLIITFLAFLSYAFRAYKVTALNVFHFDWNWEEVRRSYRFGLAAFVTNISNNTLTQLDRLVIPAYFSPAQLSYYSLPGNVAEKINGVTGSSTSVLFPMLSSLSSSDERAKIQDIYIRIFRNIPVLAVAMALSAALFADKILLYWVGEDFAKNGALVLVILAATNAILSVYSVLQNFLLGYGKVRFLMKCSLFMAAVNVGFLFLLLPKFGITGAAWAYLVSVLPALFAFWWAEKKFLNLSGRGRHYLKLFFQLLVTSAIFSAVVLLLAKPLVTGLLSLIVFGIASVSGFLVLYKLLGFVEKEDWEVYRRFFRIIAIKLKI